MIVENIPCVKFDIFNNVIINTQFQDDFDVNEALESLNDETKVFYFQIEVNSQLWRDISTANSVPEKIIALTDWLWTRSNKNINTNYLWTNNLSNHEFAG